MVKKKRFPCGHVGHGRWCHRCDAAENCEKEMKRLEQTKGAGAAEKRAKLAATVQGLREIPKCRWKVAPDVCFFGFKKKEGH